MSTDERPGRNEPCWCGSGQKYKKCHLSRAEQPPVPVGRLRHDLMHEFEFKQCLHPQASPERCNRIVAAHTIQRSGALSRIIDRDKRVMRFDPFNRTPHGALNLQSIGWKQASTFHGFCGRHDNQTFEPLEKQKFNGTPEQCFLIGYRALCHELHQKNAAVRALPDLRDRLDRGRSEIGQQWIQARLSAKNAGLIKGLKNNQAIKQRADMALLSSDFSEWARYIVYFRGDIAVVSTGAPTPTFDLDDRELQVLHDPEVSIEPLYYGVVTTEEGGAVVFTWLRDMPAPQRFIDSLDALPVSDRPGVLVQFMFAYVSNTFFSHDWWKSLSDKQREWIQELAGLINQQYYKAISYRSDRWVDWEVTRIVRG
jgi:hypothetical protein